MLPALQLCTSTECHCSDDTSLCILLVICVKVSRQLCHRSGTPLQHAMTVHSMTAAGTGGFWSRAYMGISHCEMGLSHFSVIAMRAIDYDCVCSIDTCKDLLG